MQPIHDRMPVILPASKWDEWLDPTNDDIASLRGLAHPRSRDLLTMHPVSTDVNKVSNKGPHLIDPTTPDVAVSADREPPRRNLPHASVRVQWGLR